MFGTWTVVGIRHLTHNQVVAGSSPGGMYFNGVDNMNAGWNTMIYGNPTPTMLNQTIRATGVSEENANLMEFGINVMVGGMAYSTTPAVTTAFSMPVRQIDDAAQLWEDSFKALVKQLPETGQQNVQTLQNWARSNGFVKGPNTSGPQVWGVYDDAGNFSWRLKIKPQGSTRTGLEAGSQVPRFDARLGPGYYINPLTGQNGGRAVGTHIPL